MHGKRNKIGICQDLEHRNIPDNCNTFLYESITITVTDVGNCCPLLFKINGCFYFAKFLDQPWFINLEDAGVDCSKLDNGEDYGDLEPAGDFGVGDFNFR